MKELLTGFARSPVPAIELHVERCAACAHLLLKLLDLKDDEARETLLAEMDAAVAAARELRSELRQHVTRRVFLPISRPALRVLIDDQLDVALRAREAARQLALRPVDDLAPIASELRSVVEANLAVVAQLKESIDELGDLFTAGFRGSELDLALGMITRLETLEVNADDRFWQARRSLRAKESSLDPVTAGRLYDALAAVNAVGRSADAAARQLELLINT
ncbi:MAG: DUF47 family protein [Pseudomonadota bacterium]